MEKRAYLLLHVTSSVIFPKLFCADHHSRGFLNALMAAGIIFAVYVQQNSVVSAYQNMLFEAAKSLTATVMWLWLVLDSAFGPWYEECNKYYYRKPCDKGRRIAKTAVAVLVLLCVSTSLSFLETNGGQRAILSDARVFVFCVEELWNG